MSNLFRDSMLNKMLSYFTKVNNRLRFSVGSANRFLSDKAGDQACINDYGGIGDGTYHPLSEKYDSLASAQLHYARVPVTSLTQSIDWAATYAAVESGIYSILVPGIYVLTDSVPIKRAIKFSGSGYNNDVNLDWRLTASTFIAYGTGTKKYTALGVTDGRNNGGVFLGNPSQRFILDKDYALANYYEENGDPKKFSSLFYIGYGVAGVIFEDLMIVKNFNGMDGYLNKTNGWGDDWDVGVYMDNARYCTFRNVNVIGYWLLNGVLLRSGSLDTESTAAGIYAGSEENKFDNCVFQGWKSVGCRSIDMYKCLAVEPTYVEIAYSDANPFKTHLRVRSGEFSGIFATLLKVEKVGDRLRMFTNGNMVGRYKPGDVLVPAYFGNGVAGTVFTNCRFHGMWHTSGYSCSDTWHTRPLPPSACVEVSGTRIRGMRFEGCKVQTTDDIGFHLHQCIDTMLTPNSRFEGSTDARGKAGIRMLSTNIRYEHYIRETYRVQIQTEQPGADFRPYHSEIPSKFADEDPANYWNPTLFGTNATHGIYIGGFNDLNKIKIFHQNGFTAGFSAPDGDFKLSGVVRDAYANVLGNMVTVTFSYYAGKADFVTGNDIINFNLPHTPSFTDMYHFPISVAGRGLLDKHVSLTVTGGSKVAKLTYRGTDGNRYDLKVKDIVGTSGAVFSASGSFSYRGTV